MTANAAHSKNALPAALEGLLPAPLVQGLAAAAARAGISTEQYLRRVLHKAAGQGNAVYLSAPVTALVEGLYRQSTTLEELKRWGDFGLGTFNDLDGEMLLLDGEVYRMRADGVVSRLPEKDLPEIRTPFACVTFFRADTHDDTPPQPDGSELFTFIESILPSPNMLFAIRVEGRFSRVRVRSVPRQHGSRPLVDVAREQPEFEFRDITGSMAGFYTPPMMQGLSVSGLHLHFIDADRQRGGHLLDCRVETARCGVQHVPRLVTDLPVSLDFLTADLSRDVGADLDQAER